MNVEANVNSLSWLHGLQDYFEFTDKHDISQFCKNFLKVLYSENKAPVLRNVILEGIESKPVDNVVNFFSHTVNDEQNMKLEEISSALQLLYPDEELLNILAKYYRLHDTNIADAFSRGQVNSKTWMVSELAKIKDSFEMIHIHAGWMGQTRLYLDAAKINYEKIRIFDIDSFACKVSDTIFNNDLIEGYKAKATELRLPLRDDTEDEQNMSWVTRTGIEYEVQNYNKGNSYKEKTMPDLVINSSAEHMSSVWYHKMINRPMETDPLFVIQTNNLFDVKEHQLCVHSLDHMQKKFPMTRLEYAGEKELFGYKRFMMIGRP